MASRGSSHQRPVKPWLPKSLHVWGVYRRERAIRRRDKDSTNRLRQTTVRWDERFRVDEHEFRYGFDKKALADEFAEQLQVHFVREWLFDPAARRFVRPANVEEAGPTFYGHAVDHYRRKWPTWSPAHRRNCQRDLARACLHLVRAEAPALTGDHRDAAIEFLCTAALIVPAPETLDQTHRVWQDWFERWSLPLREVTDAHLHEFLEAVRTTARDETSRVLAPSSLARTRAVVRAVFTGARKRRLIDWDPWDAVEWRLPPDEDHIDADLVMDQQQVLVLAEACGAIDPRYECFVLAQGFCALRPGEARELRRRDLDLRKRPAEVTTRGSWSDAPERFFDEGESRERPLKGRGRRSKRTIPIPYQLVPRFQAHLDAFVEPRADALVFTTPGGRRLDMQNFSRDVWTPARESIFSEDNPLRRVRRHDLRHSAITSWLNGGVTVKTGQRWSGHRTASVLLDTYLGVMRDDASLSLARVEQLLDAALALKKSEDAHDGLVTGPSGNGPQQEENSGR
jgi:integrase